MPRKFRPAVFHTINIIFHVLQLRNLLFTRYFDTKLYIFISKLFKFKLTAKQFKYSRTKRQKNQNQQMHLDELRLFTKLKNNKKILENIGRHTSEKLIENMRINNIKQVNSQVGQEELNIDTNELSGRSSLSMNNNNQDPRIMDIKFTQQQLIELQRLKYDKICYIVDQCLTHDHNVKSVLTCEVLNNLQMEIWEIYVTGKTSFNYMTKQFNRQNNQNQYRSQFKEIINMILDKHRKKQKKYKINDEHVLCQQSSKKQQIVENQSIKVGKYLQSTAEYLQRTPEQRQNYIINANITNSICPSSFSFNSNSRFQNEVSGEKVTFNRGKSKKVSLQSTIKNLQSPASTFDLSFKPAQNSDRHKMHSNLYVKDYEQQTKQQLNVNQFTLGDVSSTQKGVNKQENHMNEDCEQNFTQREIKGMYLTDQVESCIGEFNSQALELNNYPATKLGNKQNKDEGNENFNQYSQCNMGRLAFNKRKKLPKGKAIKYKVMGNLGQQNTNCQDQYN